MDQQDLWRHIVSRFLSADVTVERMEPATGGFSNALVVDVQTSAGRYALRGWPHSGVSQERICELHRWLKHLQAGGVPVAVPLLVRHGPQTWDTAAGRTWQLEPWLPGSACRGCDLREPQISAAMAALARLHLASARYEPTAAGRKWFGTGQGTPASVTERLELIAAWSPQRLISVRDALTAAPTDFRALALAILSGFLRYADVVAAELRSQQQVVVPLHPCLRDVWAAHVLFSGDAVSGFIDPGAARTDHLSTDLSRLLGSYFADDRVRWRAALAYYERIRPLRREEQVLLRVIDRSSVLLSGMTWIQRWSEGQCPRERLSEITERLSVIAGRLRGLE